MDAYSALELFLFILPAYIANAAPVVFSGGPKLDLKRVFFDGKRLLGDGKTLFGFLGGLGSGVLAAVVLAFLLPSLFVVAAPSFETKVFAGFLLSFGALCGDLIGSFFKRRIGMARGEPSILLDQLAFLLVALAFASQYYPPSGAGIDGLLLLVALTFVLHLFFNALAHRLRLKSVPW
ncbi:MAG: CDP-2,3-bis-(O-geranylgeranyl)-sn-glycerol synthase [Candidatus Micrarchaeota archaeon]